MGRVSAHVVSGMAPDARTCHDVPGHAPEVAGRGGTPTCSRHPHFLRTDRARPPGCESGQVTPRVPRMRTGVPGVHRIPTSPHCTPGAPGAPREPEGRPLRPQSYRGTGPRPVRHRRPRSPCVPTEAGAQAPHARRCPGPAHGGRISPKSPRRSARDGAPRVPRGARPRHARPAVPGTWHGAPSPHGTSQDTVQGPRGPGCVPGTVPCRGARRGAGAPAPYRPQLGHPSTDSCPAATFGIP